MLSAFVPEKIRRIALLVGLYYLQPYPFERIVNQEKRISTHYRKSIGIVSVGSHENP